MSKDDKNLSQLHLDIKDLTCALQKTLVGLTQISEVFDTFLRLEMARSDYALSNDSGELKEALDEYYERG